MRRTYLTLVLGLLLLLLPAGTQARAGQAKLAVTVSILPQAWFVERIGGDLVDVAVLVGPGHSPATFEPTPRQLAQLQGADLFVASGVPFERGLVPRIMAMSRSPRICGPLPETGGIPEPVHDHDHDHDHGGIDPHTWLDPVQAQAMADTICAELSRLAPESAPVFAANLTAVRTRLTALDSEIRTLLAPYQGHRFYVFHPAFGHFAAAYGLIQVPVEDEGHEPGARQLATVIEQAKGSGARAIIVQPQFSRKSAGTVARAAGLEVVELDPLARDYDTNLRHMATVLADLFAREKAARP